MIKKKKGVFDSPVDADGSAVRHRPRGEGKGLPSLAEGEGVGSGVDEDGDGAQGREGHLVVGRWIYGYLEKGIQNSHVARPVY